jgi:hypothetical protein
MPYAPLQVGATGINEPNQSMDNANNKASCKVTVYKGVFQYSETWNYVRIAKK